MDRFSFLNALDIGYLNEMYDQYLQYPDSVEPSWRAFFQGFDFAQTSYGGTELLEETPDINKSPKVEEKNTETARAPRQEKYEAEGIPERFMKEFQVVQLIHAYRSRGHLFTKTNPVRERRDYKPTLDIENFGLSQSDLDTEFEAGQLLRLGKATLGRIIEYLTNIYCISIGAEYTHIQKPGMVNWIRVYLSKNENQPEFSDEQKKKILGKLNEAISFESFLNTKYVGQKRFSIEGNESLIPGLDALVEAAAEKGVNEFVMGMAHRGRLNTLTHIFGKSPKEIFLEFEGKDYEDKMLEGDVTYHLGWTSCRETESGKKINLNLAPNPSHLEAVGPLVEGIARAKQDDFHREDPQSVLPIIVHGDAAIAGQGVVYETIQMSRLKGYTTYGTIHIVINNQIGFTTNYTDGRSSTYCTDVGKLTDSPILHINADDPEAVVHGMLFALNFRMHFGQDVFIDLLGYRKYGHNEGDEPRFTQPKLYKSIAKHKNARDSYAEKLEKEGVIDGEYLKEIEKTYKDKLEEDLESSQKIKAAKITPIMQDIWDDYTFGTKEDMISTVDTSYDLKKLDEIAEKITTLPEGMKFIRKVDRIIKQRRDGYFEKDELDWGMAETLAYGTLLEEEHDIRIAGQDSVRGTFSHRHAALVTEEGEEEVVLLHQMENNSKFYIYNSLLSEYAAMGFEYGYSMASPNTLNVWEAQFGDFSNGAQIIIDQYLSAAEEKWMLRNGLVLYLPHGYEGQGAEHSSARMERFLQLCAEENMFVANCTTPANFFHLLRRQVKIDYRKPLVIFTPKSLLRHPRAKSTKEELANGQFQMLIDDSQAKPEKIKSVVFCSGKFYYDLLAAKEEMNREDVALVRIEQLFPLPEKEIQQVLDRYKNAHDIVWAQEEPKNMGAYTHLLLRLKGIENFRVCSRKLYAAPASGSSERFKRRHKKVIESVFKTPEK